MSNFAGKTGLTFGITDNAFGYFESAVITEAAKTISAADGGGVTKRVEWWDNITSLALTYVHLLDASSPTVNVGSGTAVSFTDPDIPDTFIDDAELSKQGGLSPDYMRVSANGRSFPALGA